ncbi:MAG: rRNA maturation RNase YbeY [Candidatus Omnitrophica bacterium]|nr:rRNA maturation RNase YbeY [Candidatus Omnitrophota bacterium]
MRVRVTNAQRQAPVSAARMRQLARAAVRRLKIRGGGELAITFIDTGRMRRLNRRFTRHDRSTDVLSFRYEGEPTCWPAPLRRRQVVGEVLVAPKEAQRYAQAHGVSYAQELSRYVVHGILHWLGHDDRTLTQQREMRKLEDRLLANCSEDTKRWTRDSRLGTRVTSHGSRV